MINGESRIERFSVRIIAMRTLLAAFLLAGVVAVLLTTSIDLIWFRDVGYPDSASVLRVGEYARTGTIYLDPNRPPYLVSLYGPLFYVLLSFPARLAGSVDAMRMIARLTIAAFWISSLALLFLIVRRISGSIISGVWAVAFACTPVVIAHWTTQIRGDLLGITFSLLSIYFVSAENRPLHLPLAALWSVLALLCKQTFIAAPLAVLFYLLWRRRFSQAALWAGAIGVGTLAGYGFVIWREPYAWIELTALAKPIYSFHSGVLLAEQGLWNVAPVIALLGVIAAARRPWGKGLLVLLYCVMTWIVALTLIPQVGGSTNYFLEPLTASAALASVTLPSLEDAIEHLPRLVLASAALAFVFFFGPLLRADWALLVDSRFRAQHYTVYRADWIAFISSVAQRPLLSSYPDVTIYGGKPQVPDTLLNSVLAERGKWSWNPVIDSLNRSEYELLVMYPYFLRGSGQYRGLSYWNRGVFDAVQRNYALAGLCAGMEIWTPRNAGPGSWKYETTEGCIPPARR